MAPAGEGGAPRPARLHFIDWLRLLMVLGVIFAHTCKSGVTRNGLNDSWMIDDRTLWDHSGYRAFFPDRGGPDPFAYEGRWVSVVRPWCLPLLFWVSGAAVACTYRGGRPKGTLKLLIITFVGMASNAALWFLGPLDDRCYVGNFACAEDGLLFNFTIVLWAGPLFAVLFQMWYTLVLVVLQYLNWPLLGVIGGFFKPPFLGLQWALNVAMYTAMVAGSRKKTSALAVLPASMALEAAFLAAAWASSLKAPLAFLERVPVRAYHYVMAAVSVLQFSAIHYAEHMEGINLTYLIYIVTGFNKFYQLGFVMTRARRSPTGDTALPLASRVWPLMLVLWVVTSPSTNWDIAGNLTYPYFESVVDRCLYTSGAMLVIFSLDRASRGVECEAVPPFVTDTGLFLYVFHPWLITIAIAIGMRSIGAIAVVVVLAGLALMGFKAVAARWCKKRAARAPGESSGSDGEDEEDEDESDPELDSA